MYALSLSGVLKLPNNCQALFACSSSSENWEFPFFITKREFFHFLYAKVSHKPHWSTLKPEGGGGRREKRALKKFSLNRWNFSAENDIFHVCTQWQKFGNLWMSCEKLFGIFFMFLWQNKLVSWRILIFVNTPQVDVCEKSSLARFYDDTLIVIAHVCDKFYFFTTERRKRSWNLMRSWCPLYVSWCLEANFPPWQ